MIEEKAFKTYIIVILGLLCMALMIIDAILYKNLNITRKKHIVGLITSLGVVVSLDHLLLGIVQAAHAYMWYLMLQENIKYKKALYEYWIQAKDKYSSLKESTKHLREELRAEGVKPRKLNYELLEKQFNKKIQKDARNLQNN